MSVLAKLKVRIVTACKNTKHETCELLVMMKYSLSAAEEEAAEAVRWHLREAGACLHLRGGVCFC